MPNELAEIRDKLSKPESKRLDVLEEQIDSSLRSYLVIGESLREIRDSRLYRESFGTFEDYCQNRWSMTRQHVNRCIAAEQTVKRLEPTGSILPSNERQARLLTSLPEDKQAAAWQSVIDQAPEVDGEPHITAALVSRVVKEMSGEKSATNSETDNAPMPLDEALEIMSAAVRQIRQRCPKEFHDIIASQLRNLAKELEEGISDDPGRKGSRGPGTDKSKSAARRTACLSN